jgi:hypothetical protein
MSVVAYLSHSPRQKASCHLRAGLNTDLLTLSLPLAMEQPVIKKYKLKKDIPPVKTSLYMGLFCGTISNYGWLIRWRS